MTLIPIDEYGKDNLKIGDIVTSQLWGKDDLYHEILSKHGHEFICDYGGTGRSCDDFSDWGGYKYYYDTRNVVERNPILLVPIIIVVLFILSFICS